MKKIPRCAWCGESMSMRRAADERRGRVLHDYRGLPGAPLIGWHHDCAGADPINRALNEERPNDLDQIKRRIAQINRRHPNRVTISPVGWNWIRPLT